MWLLATTAASAVVGDTVPHGAGFPPPHGRGHLLIQRGLRTQTGHQEEPKQGGCLDFQPALSVGWKGEIYLYIWKSVGVFICREVWVPSPRGMLGARAREGSGVGTLGWG